jgi:hypothetical protein
MIGSLVRETILLKRAQLCEHDWVKLNKNDVEYQCNKCTIIIDTSIRSLPKNGLK